MNRKTNGINQTAIKMNYKTKGMFPLGISPQNKSSQYYHQKQYSDYGVIDPEKSKNEKIIHRSIKRNFDPEGNAIITTKIVREIDYDDNKNNFNSNSIMNIKPKAMNSSYQRNNEHQKKILRYSNYSNNEEINNSSAVYHNQNYGYDAFSPDSYESHENNYTKINNYSGSGMESEGAREFYSGYGSQGNYKISDLSPVMPNYTSGSDFDDPNPLAIRQNENKYMDNNYRSNIKYSQRIGLNKRKYNRYNLESPYTQNDDFDSPDRNNDYNTPYFRNIQIDKIKGIKPIYQTKRNNMMSNQIETSGEYDRSYNINRRNWGRSPNSSVYRNYSEIRNPYDILNEKAVQLQSNVRGFLVRKKVLRYITLAIYYQSFCDKIQDVLVFHVREEIFNILKNKLLNKNKYGRNITRESPFSKRKNHISTRYDNENYQINNRSRNPNENRGYEYNRSKIIKKEYNMIHDDENTPPKGMQREYSENVIFNRMNKTSRTNKNICKKNNLNYSVNYTNSDFKKFDYSVSPTKKVTHYFISSPCSHNKPHNRYYKEITGKSTTYRSYKNIKDLKSFSNYRNKGYYKYENNTSTMFQDKPDYYSGIGTRSYSRGLVKSTYTSSNQNINRCHCLDDYRKKKVNIYTEKTDYDIRTDINTHRLVRQEEERRYNINRFNEDEMESDNYLSLNIVRIPQRRVSSTDQKEETYTKTVETKEYMEDKSNKVVNQDKRKRFSKIEMNKGETIKIMPLLGKKTEVKKEIFDQEKRSVSTRDIFTNTSMEPNRVAKLETINIAGKKKEIIVPKVDKEKEKRDKERVEIEIERRVKERVEIEKKEIERLDKERKDKERKDRLEKEKRDKEREKKDKEKRDQEELLLIEREKKIQIEQEKIEKERKNIERREKEAERRREMEEKKRKDWEEQERIEKEKRLKEDQDRKDREKKDKERRDKLDRERREREKKEMEQMLIIERERIIKEETERIENEMKEKERKQREERLKREREEKLRKEKAERDRIEREKKLEEERKEKERKEKERKDQLEREKREKERKEREEQLRIERERKRKEEQERIEREKRERERKEREEKLKKEREERMRKEEQERIERERKIKIEKDRIERENKEKERKAQLERERIERERKIKIEQERIERERKEKERRDKEAQRKREQEEKERLEKIRIEKTKIIERNRIIQLEKEKQERKKQEEAPKKVVTTTTTTTKKITIPQYKPDTSKGKETTQTKVVTTQYKSNISTVKVKESGGGKYPSFGPNGEYILKKDCQKNLNEMKLKLEKEYEQKIEMEKRRGKEELRINQENMEKKNRIEIEKLIEMHKQKDNERLREIEREKEILKKREIELEKLKEKEVKMGIQLESEKQKETQRLKEIEERNKKNKLIRMNKEIEINLKNAEIVDRKQHTVIKRDREKDIQRAKEIIKIFILSRCDPLMKKRKYFNVWRRKARYLELLENSKIIQEFCRGNLEMNRIKKIIKKWKNLSKKLYYKSRIKLLKMKPRLSKKNIRIKKIYELIRITKLNTIFSRRRFIHFIILIWHIYAKNIHRKRVNMKYLYENLLKTYMNLANDIFGNNQYENPSVQDAMYEAVNTNKFITLMPDDVPLARKHYEEMRKIKSVDSKDKGIYGNKIVKSATTTRLEIEKKEVKKKSYMGKINENIKDENNSESDETERKKEEKRKKLDFLEKYRKNRIINQYTDNKQNNSYTTGYNKYNKTSYDSDNKKDYKNNINKVETNIVKTSYINKFPNKTEKEEDKFKTTKKVEETKYIYNKYTKTEGNQSNDGTSKYMYVSKNKNDSDNKDGKYSYNSNKNKDDGKYSYNSNKNKDDGKYSYNSNKNKDDGKYSYNSNKNKDDGKYNTKYGNNINVIYSSNLKPETISSNKSDTSKYENKSISNLSNIGSRKEISINIKKPQTVNKPSVPYDTYQKKVYVKTTTEEPTYFSKKIEIKATTTSTGGNMGNNNSVYVSKRDDLNKKEEIKNELHKSKTEGKMNVGYKSNHFNSVEKSSNKIDTSKYGNKVETKVEKKIEMQPYRSNGSISQDSKKVVITKKYQSSRINK